MLSSAGPKVGRPVEGGLGLPWERLAGLDVWFPETPEPHALELLKTLGVNVRVHPSARDGKLPGVEVALETRLCKISGCPDEAAYTRGPYAKLCAYHASLRRPESEERGRKGGLARASANGSKPANGKALERSAKELVPLCRRLERAAAAKKTANGELASVIAEFNEALRGLNEAAKSLLA